MKTLLVFHPGRYRSTNVFGKAKHCRYLLVSLAAWSFGDVTNSDSVCVWHWKNKGENVVCFFSFFLLIFSAFFSASLLDFLFFTIKRFFFPLYYATIFGSLSCHCFLSFPFLLFAFFFSWSRYPNRSPSLPVKLSRVFSRDGTIPSTCQTSRYLGLY